MTILSIQSHVVSGHVGHQAATLPLQRMGFDVLTIPSVLYSNHPGYGAFEGDAVGAALIADIIQGLKRHKALDKARAIHSGYLANAQQAEIVCDLVKSIGSASHPVPYFFDPVMGNKDKGFYVDRALADFFKDKGVPAADVILPNHFELEFLTERSVTTLQEAIAAADAIRDRGVGTVIATSLHLSDHFPEGLCNLAVSDKGTYLGVVPLLQNTPRGCGDLLTALFMGRWLKHDSLQHAFRHALTATHRILELSLHAESTELLIVEGQDHVVSPGNLVAVNQIR